jgi:chromosomal replication initiation ATPase DnaA
MIDFYNVCPYKFQGEFVKLRKQEVVMWRNVGMIWAWLGGKSLTDAGKEFHRDHTTVLHALKQLESAFKGWGCNEIIDNIEAIKLKSPNFIHTTEDICVNYAKNLVRLDALIGKKL